MDSRAVLRLSAGTSIAPSVAGALTCILAGAGLALASRASGRADGIETALFGAFGSLLALLAWVDHNTRTIPNTIVYPSIALGLVVAPLWPDRGITESLSGGLTALVATSAIRTAVPGGLGGGDVKMATLLGVVVGYPTVILAGTVTALAGGAFAVGLLLLRGHGSRRTLPYAPAIAAGVLAAICT